MKYFYILLLVLLASLPHTTLAQAFKLEIRDQRVVNYDDGSGFITKEFHFKVYMSRVDNSPSPNPNLYLAATDLRLNFNSANFDFPAFGQSQVGDISNYNVTGSIGTDILSINITPPAITNSVSTDAYNIALAPGATYIGDFFVTGIKENPGTMDLVWRDANAATNPSTVSKFLEDGSNGTTDISGLGQFVNPPSAFLTDLHVHFTGDGSESNLYKIYVQSASGQELAAGTIGFYVYFSSSKAELAYTVDDQVTGNPLNWGNTASRSVTVEEGVFADGFDRRFKYVHAAGNTEGGRWPAFVDDPLRVDEGINIGGLRFRTSATEDGDPMNVVKFEPIDAASFKNYGNTINYSLTIDNPTHPLGTAATTLPVTLTHFSAGLQANQQVLLKWSTAMEINNKAFVVQRSADLLAFTDVATLPGAGNSTSPLHYSTIDALCLPGTSYYRLKQVDFDGTSSYSKVIAVRNTAPPARLLSIQAAQPNPFQEQTLVHYRLPQAASVSILLSDGTGQVISRAAVKAQAGLNTYTLDGSRLAQGIYLLNISDGSSRSSFKLVKR